MQFNKVTHVLFDLDGLLLGKFQLKPNHNKVAVSYIINLRKNLGTFRVFLLISDSEVLYTEAFTRVSAKYGKEFTWELKSSLLGFQGQECADKIIDKLDLPITREEFMSQCGDEYEQLFPNVKLMPGNIHLRSNIYYRKVPIFIQ